MFLEAFERISEVPSAFCFKKSLKESLGIPGVVFERILKIPSFLFPGVLFERILEVPGVLFDRISEVPSVLFLEHLKESQKPQVFFFKKRKFGRIFHDS